MPDEPTREADQKTGSTAHRQVRRPICLCRGHRRLPGVFPGYCQEELGLLWERGILEPVLELRCCSCGDIMAPTNSPVS